MSWLAYETWRVARSAAVIGLLALLLVYAPWPIRNAYRFHAFIPLRSTVGLELYMGNRPGATGHLDESLFPMFNRQELASYLSKGEVAYTNVSLLGGDGQSQWTACLRGPRTAYDRIWFCRARAYLPQTNALVCGHDDSAIAAVSTSLLHHSR